METSQTNTSLIYILNANPVLSQSWILVNSVKNIEKCLSYLQTIEELSQTLDALCHLQKTVLLQ